MSLDLSRLEKRIGYLPVQSVQANVAAAIQILFGTAQLNGLNPADWLKDILTKLPIWPNNRIDELLPLAPEFIKSLKQKNLRW